MDQEPNATETDHDRKTDAINADGEAFFSPTTWQGKRAMRVSVVNWRTNDQDVKRTIESVKKIIADYR